MEHQDPRARGTVTRWGNPGRLRHDKGQQVARPASRLAASAFSWSQKAVPTEASRGKAPLTILTPHIHPQYAVSNSLSPKWHRTGFKLSWQQIGCGFHSQPLVDPTSDNLGCSMRGRFWFMKMILRKVMPHFTVMPTLLWWPGAKPQGLPGGPGPARLSQWELQTRHRFYSNLIGPESQCHLVKISTGFLLVKVSYQVLIHVWKGQGPRTGQTINKRRKTRVHDWHWYISLLIKKLSSSWHCGTRTKLDKNISGTEWKPQKSHTLLFQPKCQTNLGNTKKVYLQITWNNRINLWEKLNSNPYLAPHTIISQCTIDGKGVGRTTDSLGKHRKVHLRPWGQQTHLSEDTKCSMSGR